MEQQIERHAENISKWENFRQKKLLTERKYNNSLYYFFVSI